MLIEQKNNIIDILRTIVPSKEAVVSDVLREKVAEVAAILNKCPELKSDRQFCVYLLSKIKGTDAKITQFRRSLVDNCLLLDKKLGILNTTRSELNELSENDLWEYIEKLNLKKLVISFEEGGTVVYEKGFLKRLIEKKPNVETLSEMFTIEFKEGTMILPKAKLMQFGEFFESILETSMSENLKKLIKFPDISIYGFVDIIHAIENEAPEFKRYGEEFNKAAHYFQFYITVKDLPKGLYGKEALEKYFGDVGVVPFPSVELLEALEAPCPFSSQIVKTKDTHICMWIPKTAGVAENRPLSINNVLEVMESFHQIKSDYSQGFPHDLCNRGIGGGYWLLMKKDPIQCGRRYPSASKYIEEFHPHYAPPCTSDVVLASLMNYACSGEMIMPWKPFTSFDHYQTRYTWCSYEYYSVDRLAHVRTYIGCFTKKEFSMHAERDSGSQEIGICPVRKFHM